MENADRIKEALSKLDKTNDAHWTGDGLPRLEVVQELSGIKDIRRKDLTDLAPTFTRDEPPAKPPETDVRTDGATSAAPLQPTVEEPVLEEPSDDLQAAEEDLADAQRALVEIEAAKAKITIAAQRAAERVDAAIAARDAIAPKQTTIHDIQDYLKNQLGQRAERADRVRVMREANFDPKILFPQGSPIDAAMSRKTGYGKNRPNFNTPKA